MILRFKLLLLLSVFLTLKLSAREPALFKLTLYETAGRNTIAFVSISDIYPLSEHPDSLAIPELSEIAAEQAPQFEYFKLPSKYRSQLLVKTGISETDKMFIYSYATNKLISFPVGDLNAVACLNIYGAQWPYTQNDFMIGFEIDKKYLSGYEGYFGNTLVYIGKESPFVVNQLKPVVWKETAPGKFPLKEIPPYDTVYTGECRPAGSYYFETDNLAYFVQDMKRISDVYISLKCLVVIDKQTRQTVCKKLFYAGEGSSFAPLNNQWTGKLFKNEPPVILGFQYLSFGCESITFIQPAEKSVEIKCDNRH